MISIVLQNLVLLARFLAHHLLHLYSRRLSAVVVVHSGEWKVPGGIIFEHNRETSDFMELQMVADS